jgi:hypothetical protein
MKSYTKESPSTGPPLSNSIEFDPYTIGERLE